MAPLPAPIIKLKLLFRTEEKHHVMHGKPQLKTTNGILDILKDLSKFATSNSRIRNSATFETLILT